MDTCAKVVGVAKTIANMAIVSVQHGASRFASKRIFGVYESALYLVRVGGFKNGMFAWWATWMIGLQGGGGIPRLSGIFIGTSLLIDCPRRCFNSRQSGSVQGHQSCNSTAAPKRCQAGLLEGCGDAGVVDSHFQVEHVVLLVNASAAATTHANTACLLVSSHSNIPFICIDSHRRTTPRTSVLLASLATFSLTVPERVRLKKSCCRTHSPTCLIHVLKMSYQHVPQVRCARRKCMLGGEKCRFVPREAEP